MKLSPQLNNSFEPTLSQLKIDEVQLDKVLDVEETISISDQITVFNIQLQIDKIINKIILTPLDECRLDRFNDRVEEIYEKYQPSTEVFKLFN